jgi:hypothetical protein
MIKKFKRTNEDFTCEHCGATVAGTGYTNHCPACLWSKHVDIHPGDRAAACSALMEPIGVELKAGEYILLHRCVRCGFERKNRTSPADNFEAMLAIQKRVG